MPVAFSQQNLPETLIREARFDQTGFTAWRADTLPLLGALSLSERLRWSNSLDIRANAPGTLATASARGLGPARTAVLWNGLNLQSPQNGVYDLALLPVWATDRLEVRYGGQSAAQSTGAVGGSILLEQNAPPPGATSGFWGETNARYGSFNRREGAVRVGLNRPFWSSELRLNGQRADHDFPFRNTALIGAPSMRQVNNHLAKWDVQQFNQLIVNAKNTMRTAFWQQAAFREIPPTLTSANDGSWQRDRATRAVVTWDHSLNPRALLRTRVAWNNEWLAYRSAADVDSSRARTALLSTEYTYQLAARWRLRLGLNTQFQQGQADGYTDSVRWYHQWRGAGFGMLERQGARGRVSLLLRQEWAEHQRVPFTWSLGGEQRCWPGGGLRGHASRNFTLPTFNDRVWRSLGNPDLRSESGYSADAGIFQHIQLAPYAHLSAEASAFGILMDDWILWQPGSDGQFRPGNLRRVRSLGGEAHLRGDFRLPARWQLRVDARYQHVQATNVAAYGGVTDVVGRDLPYTPRHSGSCAVSLVKNWLSTTYLQTWVGPRFTTTDNQATVAGYSVAYWLTSVQLGRHWALDLRLENCWNRTYQVLAYRPMPGRAWMLGIQYSIQPR